MLTVSSPVSPLSDEGTCSRSSKHFINSLFINFDMISEIEKEHAALRSAAWQTRQLDVNAFNLVTDNGGKKQESVEGEKR